MENPNGLIVRYLEHRSGRKSEVELCCFEVQPIHEASILRGDPPVLMGFRCFWHNELESDPIDCDVNHTDVKLGDFLGVEVDDGMIWGGECGVKDAAEVIDLGFGD